MKTVEVCRTHGIPMLRIRYLLAQGRITPPEKDVSGDYRWTQENIDELLANVAPAAGKCAAEPAAAGAA